MRWSPTSRFSVSSATPHISRRSRRKRRHEHRARHAGRFRQIVRAVLPARDGGRRAHLRLLAREPETVRQGGARHHRRRGQAVAVRSEEHTSELQSLMRISYAVFCLQKKTEQKIIRDIKKPKKATKCTMCKKLTSNM